MTIKGLKKERKRFLLGFIGIVVISNILIVLDQMYLQSTLTYNVRAEIISTPLKIIFAYFFVTRFADYLQKSNLLVAIYAVLSILPILYLIPFIGLLYSCSKQIKLLEKTHNT
jgi:hypothetical protein